MRLDNLRIFTIVNSIFTLVFGLIAPFYVIFVNKIGGGIENLGIAFALLQLASSTTSYFFGKFSDKLGRKPFLILAGYLNGVIIAAYTLVTNVYQLYPMQILWGIVSAMESTIATSFLGDITKRHKRGTQIGSYNMIVGIFGSFSLVLGGFLISRFGFKVIFYIVSITYIIATTMLFLIRENRRRK